MSDPSAQPPGLRPVRVGRFPRNDIISLLDHFPTHNLGESTSQDLTFGDVLDLIGADELRDLRLGYGTAAGDATLRARVGELTGMQPDQVITTQGVALGLYLLAVEHCRPGDEVLIVTPTFPPTRDAMIGSGVTVNTVPLSFDAGYRIDAEVIAPALTAGTVLVCLASPQNPSGVRARREDIEALLDHMTRVCPQALLLVDEIYRDATYGDAAIPQSFATADSRVITSGSISKAHGAPGLRCGWLTIHDPDLRDRLIVAKMNIVLSGSVLDEAVAAALLAVRDDVLRPRRAAARGRVADRRAMAAQRNRARRLGPSRGRRNVLHPAASRHLRRHVGATLLGGHARAGSATRRRGMVRRVRPHRSPRVRLPATRSTVTRFGTTHQSARSRRTSTWTQLSSRRC